MVNQGAAGVSPLLLNVYRQALDRPFADGAHGRLVRYADDFVGLELHPDKTKVVDLREAREEFDFLGCHCRACVSGRVLERGVRRCYLRRWPSQRAMKRVRGNVKAKTGRGRAGRDIREVIADLNPILRGWGNYFRTGNAAKRFNQIDRCVLDRLRGLMINRCGRNLRAGPGQLWTREWFEEHGLYRLRGTVRYPGYAS